MATERNKITCLTCIIALSIILAAGCSDGTASSIASYNNANIKRLTNLYSSYQAAHSFQGPTDEASLRSFVKDQAPWRLQLMQVDADKLDELFISERDHKPFKVKYGVVSGPGAVNALVFEQQGTSGKRQVGLNGGTVEEADEAQYKEMWEGHWHAPRPGTAPSNSLDHPPTAAEKR
jgi:hypothetical protein